MWNPIRDWKYSDARWLIFGGSFTLLVVTLLLYLHLAGAEVVEHSRHWERQKSLFVCDAPEWVTEHLDEALDLVAPWASYDRVVVSDFCADLEVHSCSYETPRGLRETLCTTEGVLLTLASQDFDFGSMESGGHGDETLSLWTGDGKLLAVTVEFPSSLVTVAPIRFSAEGNLLSTTWPANVEVLITAHALLHAEGYDHVITDLWGPFYAEPSGHLMASSIPRLGTDSSGL